VSGALDVTAKRMKVYSNEARQNMSMYPPSEKGLLSFHPISAFLKRYAIKTVIKVRLTKVITLPVTKL
jgi:hypothetical protein